jgi:hypothetical protein
MSIDHPKYDVAISFLSKDGDIAAAFNDKLSEGLGVFFFPRTQEELAGTDGLESMRQPFFDDSRVNVVLYRTGWGQTPWTRVEETAIKEACLAFGWQRLFFVVLGRENTFPVWLPQYHVRLNYADYGLEQAVGAIKARVQENGGQNLRVTAVRRAEMLRAEELFSLDRARMNSEEGLKAIVSAVRELFTEIERQCAEVNAKGSIQIKCESDFRERSASQVCIVTNDAVSLTVAWNQPYTNILDGTSLVVREVKGRIILPSEVGSRMYLNEPRVISEARYSADLSLAREYGWKQSGKTEFLSSVTLGEKCVIAFLDLAGRAVRREFR